MRVAVMAAGAVGGYFGARLAAAGHDVTFFARGAHLDAIRKDGLKVESPLGDLHLKNVNATDDVSSVAPVDLVLLAGTSSITASTRQSIGPIRDDPDMRALFFKLMNETLTVGRAAGVRLPESFEQELQQSAEAFPPTMKASMANDLDAGNRLELDWLAGKVVALGRKLNVPTPAQETVYAVLKPFRMGRNG